MKVYIIDYSKSAETTTQYREHKKFCKVLHVCPSFVIVAHETATLEPPTKKNVTQKKTIKST